MTSQEIDQLIQMVDVAHFGARRCGFRCDASQLALLRGATKRVILNCSRQSGKSTVTALKAVHCAVFRPGCTIVVTAKVQKQTREFLRKAKAFGMIAGVLARGDKFTVQFRNGSRIVGVAADEDNILGFSSVALIIMDEAARVKDEVYYALLPMLAVSDGSLWLVSTPKGQRGFFYKEWMEGGKAWFRHSVRGEDCPRIPASFLEEQRQRLGLRRFAQDFECLFVDLKRGLFNLDLVRQAFRKDIPPLTELGMA